MLNFFKAYPEFSKNDFYITGESYAGIYVPTLANRIVDGNAAGLPFINLKGIAVGDGCIGNAVGTCGDGGDADQILVDFFYGHGTSTWTLPTGTLPFITACRQSRQSLTYAVVRRVSGVSL